MAEKTREEFLAEFAKNIFDETYFSTFTDDNAFFDAAKYLKDNGIPVSELDKQFKKLQQKYVGSRPRAKDNLFDIIGSEYGRSEVKGMRDRFGFDSTKEFNSRTEARKEEKAAEALEEQPAEPAEVAEAVEPQAEAVQAAPKEQVDVDQGPTLENPAGLAAMADNLGARFRDPRIKSIPAIQRRNMEKALNAQALRGIDEDIAKKRREDRTQKIFDDRDADLKEAWARSRTGRRTGLTFDELDADTQADMRNRYNDSREAGAYSDEKYEAYKENTKDPLEKEYERKLKALQESRALPPQDPFIEETKTDAMFTQPRGPESFEMDPAAAASASAFYDNAVKRAASLEDPAASANAFYDNAVKRAASLEGMPPSESGYSSADSKPFQVDTTSKDKFGPRREYTFTDPTRPEKPVAPESFELFMPPSESGYSSADSKPFQVDTTSKDKFGPRREYVFTDPTRPQKPIAPESFELFMPPNEAGYSSADSKPFQVDTTSKDKFGPRREYMFTDPTRPEKPIASESFELFMPPSEAGYSSSDSKPSPVDTTSKDPTAAANAFYDNAVKRAASLEGMPPSESGYSSADSKPFQVDTTSKDKFGPRREYTFTDPTRPEKPIASESFELFMPEANPGKSLTSQQPTLDEPVSVPPSQDSLKPKPAYTAENAQQDYDEIKAMRDMEEAKRISQLNSQIQLTNMQKSKAQNIADTKAYHNQTAPTYGKRNDGTYGIMHDPRSPQAMKERSVVMQGINNSKSGDPMQDWMDSRKEEDERKRRQQKFVSQSKASPFYNKSIFG